MSKQIDQKIKQFNRDIESMNARKASQRAKKEVKELLKSYSIATVRTYLTRYRKALESDSALVMNALTLSASNQNKIERAYTKKIAKAQKKLSKIRNHEQMIQRAIELLDSSKYSEIVSALCLLSGRRMTEILKTAKFTNSKNSKKTMYFQGQLKSSQSALKYEIYVLGNSRDKCKRALKRLRELVDTKSMSNLEVSRKYETTINAKINAHFKQYLGTCSAHDLRKAYATICAQEFRPNYQTHNSFLAQILGHDSDDVKTANSYQKYYI